MGRASFPAYRPGTARANSLASLAMNVVVPEVVPEASEASYMTRSESRSALSTTSEQERERLTRISWQESQDGPGGDSPAAPPGGLHEDGGGGALQPLLQQPPLQQQQQQQQQQATLKAAETSAGRTHAAGSQFQAARATLRRQHGATTLEVGP